MAREVGLIYSIRRERYRLQDWLGRWWMLVALVAVVAFAAGMIAAFVPGTKHLSFKIKGQCVSAPRGGVLYGVGGGFKPYESYSIEVTRNGQYYSYYGPVNGEADALGHPSYFVWPCDDNYSDGKNITPPGKYKVTLTMLDSYKQVT